MNEQITFTDNAISQVAQIIQTDAVPEGTTAIRVFVEGGGCSGFQYGFSPASDQQINDDDVVFKYDTVKFVVDPLSLIYLNGAVVDYKRDVMAQQFTISNPNATGQCGCGYSFSA